MNIGIIAERFIRAAEIERNLHEHVGPAPLRAQQLPYTHDWNDKAGWRKEPGDKLIKGEDPLSDERKAFWERLGVTPTSRELSELDALFDWLMAVHNEKERRALLAWARAKAGGKSFRRWCFQTEGIHPNTGRDRKNRSLEQIKAHFGSGTNLHDRSAEIRLLHPTNEMGDVSDTFEADAGQRETLNSWLADGAFAKLMSPEFDDFSWAAKRNERRRQQARKRAA